MFDKILIVGGVAATATILFFNKKINDIPTKVDAYLEEDRKAKTTDVEVRNVDQQEEPMIKPVRNDIIIEEDPFDDDITSNDYVADDEVNEFFEQEENKIFKDLINEAAFALSRKEITEAIDIREGIIMLYHQDTPEALHQFISKMTARFDYDTSIRVQQLFNYEFIQHYQEDAIPYENCQEIRSIFFKGGIHLNSVTFGDMFCYWVDRICYDFNDRSYDEVARYLLECMDILEDRDEVYIKERCNDVMSGAHFTPDSMYGLFGIRGYHKTYQGGMSLLQQFYIYEDEHSDIIAEETASAIQTTNAYCMADDMDDEWDDEY